MRTSWLLSIGLCGLLWFCGCGVTINIGDNANDNDDDSPNTEAVSYDGLPAGKAQSGFLANYAVRSRWQKQNLTYYFINTSDDLSNSETRAVLADALNTWATSTALTFTEVDSPENADMEIGFGDDAHCELYQAANTQCPADLGYEEAIFDGPGSILAHCYFPPGSGGEWAGDCHFEEFNNWVDTSSGSGVRLYDVALHEIGHGLGLDHSEIESAVMYYLYDPSIIKDSLSSDDIQAVQSLYGAGDGSTPPDMTPRPETPTDVPTAEEVDPTTEDTDGDGVDDYTELFILGTNPEDADTDLDGLIDYEVAYGLDPLNPDTDGDGIYDGEEVENGTDPFVPDSGDFSGGDVSDLVGSYAGADNLGSSLYFDIYDDGSVVGTFYVLQFGYETDIALFGGVNEEGEFVLLSYDYFYSFLGTVGGGFAAGDLETSAGYVGTWEADLTEGGGGDGGLGDTNDEICADTEYCCEFDGWCDEGCPEPDIDCEEDSEQEYCEDYCDFAADGECDDGGPGADYSACDYGSDCTDCGVRFPEAARTAKRHVASRRVIQRNITDVYCPVPHQAHPLTHPAHLKVRWQYMHDGAGDHAHHPGRHLEQ
ncbi:MAG: hypothetical protein HJJLKODD_01142 [Phycisphaerae bacterium]|nr:hypothetical protein [Phycisphaerae bacterium]